MLSRLSILGSLLGFLFARKKFWLLPLVLSLLVVALLIALGATSVLAPFIYPLF